MPAASLDFGYPWWLSKGHLLVLLPALTLLLFGWRRRWPKMAMVPLALAVVWSATVFVLMHSVIDINGQAPLPTQAFLASGEGRILDIGAGTGRSSIMVLTARPHATLVATDLFGDSFNAHFGPGQAPQDRLLANLKAAGVDQRASIQMADMRQLPFEPEAFDAVVSAYAMDHLNREGSQQALAEAARVMKPGGDFLLILVANDAWGKLAFGPMLTHGGTRGSSWWSQKLRETGFRIVEEGTRPITLYFLARRA